MTAFILRPLPIPEVVATSSLEKQEMRRAGLPCKH